MAATKKKTPAKSTRRKAAPAKPAPRRTSTASQALNAFSLAALAVAAGAAIWEAVRRFRAPGNAEHEAPDLGLDQARPGPGDRAPEAFRPDPTAPVPANERDAMRPALVVDNAKLAMAD